MQSKIIEDRDVAALKVSALPTRPTAPTAFGGKGYSAEEMKAAFDKFPEFILEKLNLLIEDLLLEGEDSYIASFKTGLSPSQTLGELIAGVLNGEFSHYLTVNNKSLYEAICDLEEEIEEIKGRLGV
ncbi:MAG: hypothetical protein IJW38_04195 [Clostridia bacterium]|nr:hypothetical protein [Clostridia bacterium]